VNRQLARQPEVPLTPAGEPARDSNLLIDRYLPHYELSTAHACVLPAPPEECYRAARRIDLLRDPVIRTLLSLRSRPQRLAHRLARHKGEVAPNATPRTFRLDDMVGPPIGWILLDEEPGVEIVLGQISRPWKLDAESRDQPITPAAFASFDRPGFAKIAFNLRVEPYGARSSILTIETRVALTDPESLRRFRRYWILIGPFSSLIRRIALRLIDTDLRQRSMTRTTRDVQPLSRGERIKMRVEHEVDTRSIGLAASLYRVTRGRIARLWHRQVLLLTTHGRNSGLERTVPLQFFPDGKRMIVVAANSGLPSPPGWYFNLTANPRARIEVMDRTLHVRAEELSDDEADAFWPHVLQTAPDYARYPRRTSRRIPLVRLVPESAE